MNKEDVIKQVSKKDTDKHNSPYTFVEDFAGGSAMFIREDICHNSMEIYAIEKQIEMLEELRDLEVVNFDTYNIFKKDLQQQLQKLKDGK